jgi:hypothetical protein
MTTIYQHFGKQTRLPVHLRDVQQFILDKGVVSAIERYPCVTRHSLVGIFQKYYEIAPPYAERPLIVRIGYPTGVSEGAQRLVQTKEMLHCLDPQEATSPTKAAVCRLVDDLLFEAAEREIGLPAQVDHLNFLNALRVLMPVAALDIIRPAYKAGKLTVEQIAAEARLPAPFVAVTLTDEWRARAESPE